MADELLDRIRREVRKRKEAARPAYEESLRLEAALAALESAGGAEAVPTSEPAPPAQPSEPPARARRSARRTPRGENRRRILEVVRERPGVRAGEVAGVTGIARPTVASTLAKLAADGEVERVPHPAGGVGFRSAARDAAGSPAAAAAGPTGEPPDAGSTAEGVDPPSEDPGRTEASASEGEGSSGAGPDARDG